MPPFLNSTSTELIFDITCLTSNKNRNEKSHAISGRHGLSKRDIHLKVAVQVPTTHLCVAEIEWGWLWCGTESAPEESHHIQCRFSEKNSKNKAPQDQRGPETIRRTCPWCSRSQGMTSLPLMDAAIAFRSDTDDPQRSNPLAQKVTGKGISKCDSENRSAFYLSSSLRRDKNWFYSFYDFHSLSEWYWSLLDDFWLLLWIYTNNGYFENVYEDG